MTLIDHVRAARRVSTPLLAIRTADQQACVETLCAALGGNDGVLDSPCGQHAAAPLIPAPCAVWHPARTVVCDGTWVGPFTVLVATGGARKESGMARDPGGPVATVSGEASAMAPSRRPP